MQFPMATVFQATGEAATYTAPAGSPVSCRVKRIGGGRREHAGSLSFVVDDLSAHVLRSALTPVEGATLTIGGESWTVEAVEPVERDPQALLWCLRLTWGVEVTWFTPAADDGGSTYDPPDASVTYTAAAAPAGATTLTVLASEWTSGRIREGDNLTVDGVTYEATADVALAYASGGYRFPAVPLDAALVGALAGGEAVTITPAAPGSTRTVRAAVADFTAEEIAGGIQAGDRRLIVRASAISGQPTTSDRVTLGSEEWTVVNVRGVYAGADVAAWVVQIRR